MTCETRLAVQRAYRNLCPGFGRGRWLQNARRSYVPRYVLLCADARCARKRSYVLSYVQLCASYVPVMCQRWRHENLCGELCAELCASYVLVMC